MSLDTGLLGAGVVLILIEFIVPGFGLFGIPGIIALLAGFFFFFGGGAEAACIVGGAVAVMALFLAILFWYLPSSSRWNPFVLWDKQENQDGYTVNSDYTQYLGKQGKTVAPLRPSGTILVDGARIDVVTFGDYIEADTEVKIVKIEGNRLVVQKI